MDIGANSRNQMEKTETLLEIFLKEITAVCMLLAPFFSVQ